mgnify:CR=1 FL=1
MLGVCFMLSGVLKAVNVYSFAHEIRLYIEAYMDTYFMRWTMVIAVAVCAIEMLAALLALRREYARAAAAGYFLMLTFFVCLTGLNLFFPSVMGSIESCGCFGELIHLTPAASFVKSAVLWVTALALVAACYRRKEPWNITRLLRDRYLYVCAAVSIVLPLYSLWFFNEMSHKAYIAGFVLLCTVIALVVVRTLRQTSRRNA